MVLPLPAATAALATILLGFGYASYGLACVGLPDGRASARLSAAVALLGWLLLAAFYLLGILGLFTLVFGLVSALSSAALVVLVVRRSSVSVRALAVRDVHTAGAWLAALPVGTRLLLGLVVLLFSLHLVRGLVAPPLGWDSLTYHLVKAGRWVQQGALTFEPAPDASGYYEFMPEGGEILWAWFMLPAHGDALLMVAPVAVAFAVLLGAYAAARALGVGAVIATEAAVAVAVVPAVSRFVSVAYVDNALLAAILLAFALLLEARERPRPFVAFAAFAALAGGACVKLSGVPLLAVGALVLGAVALRAPRRLTLLAAAALALVVIVPHYAITWAKTGNPLYPTSLHLGGLSLPGNEEFDRVHAGQVGLPPGEPPLSGFLWELASRRLNFPPLLPLYAALGCVGLVIAARRRALRLPLVALGLIFATSVAGVLSSKLLALRIAWAWVTGRLVTPGYAVLVLLTALVLPRRLAVVWTLLNLVTLGWALFPMLEGLSEADLDALLAWGTVAAPALIAGIILAYALWRLRGFLPSRPRALIAVAAAIGLDLVVMGRLAEVRTEYRYRIWAAAGRREAYGPHRLSSNPLAWPLWEAADDGEEHVIAFSAGWAPPGHNWFRYPFMGEHLTNRVIYVPVTRTGVLVDAWKHEDLARAADPDAWFARLHVRQVDRVALVMPWPVESAFIRQYPGAFDCYLHGIGGYGALCRVAPR